MRKHDPVTQFVAWAENAPAESVQMVLNIVKGMLTKRLPKTAKPRVVKTTEDRSVEKAG